MVHTRDALEDMRLSGARALVLVVGLCIHFQALSSGLKFVELGITISFSGIA